MDLESVAVVIDGKQWEKDLPDMGDLELFVAPWENAAYNRALDKQVRALPANLRPDGAVEPAAFYRCVGIAMSRAILFDWRNLKVGGAEQPFDRKFAEQILTDQKYKPFRDAVVAASRRVQQGVRAADEALEGNSAPSSPGSGTGEGTATD
jgi:hypothetical protein